MNRLLRALAIILLCMPLAARADNRYNPHISIGGHAGMAMSRMSFSPSVDQAWHNGMIIGFRARYQEEKIFGLIGELNFVQRGWNENFKDNPELSYKRTLTYISIPLMTHISFGSPRFKGFVNLGPEFSVMVGNSISANFDYNHPADAAIAPTRTTEQMWTDITGHFDYGISAGIGGEFYLRPRHSISLEARFYYGLGNIFPSAKADTFSASRSMTLCATLAYNFRLR